MKTKLRLISFPFRKSGLTIGKVYKGTVYEDYPGAVVGFYDDNFQHRMISLDHFEFIEGEC